MASQGSYQLRMPVGVPGLDEVLRGGLPAHGMYLLQGNPGVGKTTFGLQFLLAGAARGEKVVYVSFSETRAELDAVAQAHGWDFDRIYLYEFLAAEQEAPMQADQTMFHPAEVELEETTRPLLEELDRVRPARLVIDSVSQIRLLARDPMRYRRHLLTLKRFLAQRGCTAILIDDNVATRHDDVVQTVVHGIISLEKLTPIYGTTRRRISVEKMRGVLYREGYHDCNIRTGGIEVFPRLVAAERVLDRPSDDPLPSGVAELDVMLGGGIERGTSTLIMGAAGTGKSSFATLYAQSAAARGEKAVIFAFEESLQTWRARARSLGFQPDRYMESGHLQFKSVDPAELSPGELAAMVVKLVEGGVRVVVIDSLNGYLQSVPEENFLLLHMHELLSYLGHQGVTTLLIMAQSGLVGPTMHSPLDVSYLADAVLMIRYFEAAGSVRKAISVVKKRRGHHERTLREFTLSSSGVQLGKPLARFQGILTGVPTILGDSPKLDGD